MNIARSEGNGFWWHVAGNPGGIYVRLASNEGVVLSRDEAARLIVGLEEVVRDGRD